MIEVHHIPVPEKLPYVLDGMHTVYGKRDIQTVRGGTQVSLSNCPYKPVLHFLRSLGLEFKGVWSVRLDPGGYHVTHNHPQGSKSGVYYVRASAGPLFINGELVQPEAGKLVMFDSSLPHGTLPFDGDGTRLTIAFDV